ncbi:tungstate ABC transporter substrate-binding protein WtpA [Sulfurovum riftiae]|uniref:Tungstate ABC transporter substrate-binding protein WtpA n=1 Tax=Sulfurovum riftiae TaxID=1630136 RepID=A0A151CJJ0_9BACT|nr:tungstate ABC transporter substrate-binding protein WtpA [Sulfurovum riftiae]KYJ87657.1 tungstate ABC transporter substrate-binding protein WtpA [Sulfurovum riftiae]
MHKIALSLLAIATLGFAKEDIIVFHAGSLAVPFSQMEKAFENKYPQYDVKREVSGSRKAARKVSEIKRPCDVVASADYKVIDNLLIPENAKFNAQFTTNEMTIAYTPRSKFANEINEKNWPEIFLRKGVKVGHSNPNVDPCGYRSILVTKLAEKYYKKPGFFKQLLGYSNFYKAGDENKAKIIVRPKETDLLALLEAHAIDYLFIYRSVAEQHGLKTITLPKEISLKEKADEAEYSTVSFRITGKKPGEYINKKGAAMVYGITIPQNEKSPANPKGAVAFVNFVLSSEGEEIMKQNGQGVISPAVITGDASILKAK